MTETEKVDATAVSQWMAERDTMSEITDDESVRLYKLFRKWRSHKHPSVAEGWMAGYEEASKESRTTIARLQADMQDLAANHKRDCEVDQARIRELEQALESQAMRDCDDGLLCFCSEEQVAERVHSVYCLEARAALAKSKEAQNG